MRRVLWSWLGVLALASPVSAQPEVDASRLHLGPSASPCVFSQGAASPEGAVSGSTCDLYLQTTTSPSLWVKVSGTNTTTLWQKLVMPGSGAGLTGPANCVPYLSAIDTQSCYTYFTFNGTGSLSISSDTGTSLSLSRSAADTDSPYLQFYQSRGTTAAKTATVTGDILGQMYFWGRDSSNALAVGAGILAVSSGTIAAGKVPAEFRFMLTSGSSGAFVNRLTIDNVGQIIPCSDTGTTGQVLTANTAGCPSWENASSSGLTGAQYEIPYFTAINTVGTNSAFTFNGTTLSAQQVNIGSATSAAPVAIRSNAAVGAYTLANSGIVMKDAAGGEIWRLRGTDPDDANWNSHNLYIGLEAGFSQPTDNVSAGYRNVGVGAWSLYDTLTTFETVAIGVSALENITNGSYLVGVGFRALNGGTTLTETTAVGYYAMNAIGTAARSTAIGSDAFSRATSGDDVTAIGAAAGFAVTAGTDNTSATGSIYLGSGTRASAAGNTNEIVIGTNTYGKGSNTATIGAPSWYQLYDASNYLLTTVGSAGAVTFNATGASAGFTFSDPVTLSTPLALTSGGTAASLTAVHGGLVYSTGSALAITAAGTAGQIATSGGAGAPAWVTLLPGANGGTGYASVKLAGIAHGLSTNYVSGTGTSGTSATAMTVKTIAVAANTLTQVGDRMRIKVFWRPDTGAAGIIGTITLNGVTISVITSGTGTAEVISEVWVEYVSSTTANVIAYGANAAIDTTRSAAAVGGFSFTASQDLDFDQNNSASNLSIVYSMTVDIFPKGVTAG